MHRCHEVKVHVAQVADLRGKDITMSGFLNLSTVFASDKKMFAHTGRRTSIHYNDVLVKLNMVCLKIEWDLIGVKKFAGIFIGSCGLTDIPCLLVA